jgi:hypothetical protein
MTLYVPKECDRLSDNERANLWQFWAKLEAFGAKVGCLPYIVMLPCELGAVVEEAAAKARNTPNAVMIEAVLALRDSGRLPRSLEEAAKSLEETHGIPAGETVENLKGGGLMGQLRSLGKKSLLS